MKRNRTSLIRRVVMWTARVVLVLSIAIWCLSLFWVSWTAQGTLTLSLESGFVYIESPTVWDPGWDLRGYRHPRWWASDIHIVLVTFPDAPTAGSAYLPIWPAAAIAAIVLIGTGVTGRGGRIRARGCRCKACAYDLTGITGPCPECGKEP